MPDKKYARKDLIAKLQKKAQELGRTPKCKDVSEEPTMPSVYTYYTMFGSMNKALREAGLAPNKVGRSKKYSDSELLDCLRSKARVLGCTPTSDDIDADPSMPSYRTYQYRFGTFQRAVRKAGLKPALRDKNNNHRSKEVKVKVRSPAQRELDRYTEEQLLNMLREKAKLLGRIPTQDELNYDRSMPSFSTYVYRFGNFQIACKKAGLLPRKHGRSEKYTDRELLDILKTKAKELGRRPVADDLGKRNAMPARQVYTYRFGGLGKALKKAGIL